VLNKGVICALECIEWVWLVGRDPLRFLVVEKQIPLRVVGICVS
jgi:hypothetical protein